MDAIVEEPEPECEFDGPWKEAIEAQGNSGNCRSCVAFTIRGLDKRRVRLLFRLIDWIMTLSPPREFDFLQEVSKTEEKQAVPFISPADVASLNTFLAAYGKLPDIALTVVIHTGSKPVTDALGGEQKCRTTGVWRSTGAVGERRTIRDKRRKNRGTSSRFTSG